MNSNTLKFIGAAALLGTWGAFAFLGKTPVDGFIAAIGAALSGLGVYHVSTSGNGTSTPSVPAESTTAVTISASAPAGATPVVPAVPSNIQQ